MGEEGDENGEGKGLFAGLTMTNSPKHSAKTADVDVPPQPLSSTASTRDSVQVPHRPPVTRAPVTDKLLGLLGTPPSSPTLSTPPKREQEKTSTVVSKPAAAMNGSHKAASVANANEDERKPPASAKVEKDSTVGEEKKFPPPPPPPPPAPAESAQEDVRKAPPPPATVDEKQSSQEIEDSETQEEDKKPAASLEEQPDGKPLAEEQQSRRQAGMQEIEDAFHVVTKEEVAASVGQIHPDTPIPNADAALRLLRKFASKTRPTIPAVCGGTQTRSVFGYLFGKSQEDVTMESYAQLMEILFDGEEEPEEQDEDNDVVVESILGHGSDNMAKARLATAAFCHTMSLWCHASSRMLDDKKSILLGRAMDTATALVARGCMDNVMIGVGGSDEYSQAVEVLAESIFVADLSDERNELAALKFLLTAGCRTSEGEALLRGTYLLQTIRVLYHVYLTTDSKHNKTTARASLQQLITSVFARMIATQEAGNASTVARQGSAVSGKDSFPSADHRDAFLVLRTMCKLSMRTLPDTNKNGHTGGLQSSGSNTMWDGGTKDAQGREEGEAPLTPRSQSSQIAEQAMSSALVSKILALELLLYVLQNTDMSGGFLLDSGPQFQYAIRNYLCVSLLKNCTSTNTSVVTLSLRLFVPLIQNFRSHLKTEIEAFVTNVFFVILDSKNSTVEHKIRVAILFEEICSDPTTLAEIFLNYDCDLSAVDLFHRIVNTLSRVAKTDQAIKSHFVAGAGATRMEKMRKEQRELRLYAMRALKQVLASLHHSFVDFGSNKNNSNPALATAGIDESFSEANSVHSSPVRSATTPSETVASPTSDSGEQTLVQIYDSKKKRRQEEAEAILRFNRKPSAGIAYAAKCGHIDGDSPLEVAKYLLKNKDELEKTQIGEYLGREAEYQNGFSLRVLHAYVNMLDFKGLLFDDAIRYYLSGFRLPGEAQKIDRIMEKFAERYTIQNPSVFPTADAAFILAFSVIMLNTDLHNPAIKEERRMTKEGFIRNNRGICDGQDLPEELLNSIFDRIKTDPISLKEDDEARERAGEGKPGAVAGTSLPSALSPAVLFSSHYDEIDRARETNFQKERDQIVRTTETLLKRKRHHSHGMDHGKSHRHYHGKLRSSVKFVRTVDTGLRDEYVVPMFDVTWAPALAAFSTAMESANGTLGALINIATDEELASAAENAAETTEVCLTGFRLAICTAGLCGNDTARDAFMLALVSFSQLGTGVLLEHRHVRCVQSLLTLGRDDGELLGNTWEHVFRALSEINRFHQVLHLMARNDRAAAAAEERRKRRLEAQERKRQERAERRRLAEESLDDSLDALPTDDDSSESDESQTESEEFSDDEPYFYDTSMDKREIDEVNARVIYEAIPESLIDAIYQRSSSLSGPAINEFIFQLCRVSRMEISGYGGHVGSDQNAIDLTQVHYRQQHTLLNSSTHGRSDQFHHNQPDIYNLQKLVEVTHYNMDSRPRLVFSEIWTPVAAHLTSTALHENAAVAMYAVDSFRQLSFQYLQREELGVFEFQSRFLKPLETVMARSRHVTTKELLLNCVERILLMFGSDESNEGTEASPASPTRSNAGHLGTLRSGWRPVLAVLGIAGHDDDEGIANAGFKLLTSQLRQCIVAENDDSEEKAGTGILIAERFIDLVAALLEYVSGPHEELSCAAIDQLVSLSSFVADENYALPVVRRRLSAVGAPASEHSQPPGDENEENRELELFWPILLGLGRSVGDPRTAVRKKSLACLFEVINGHFLPSSDEEKAEGSVTSSPKHGDLQTLQLIFRGVLTPILDNAETDTDVGSNPPVPPGFVRFITKPPLPPPLDAVNTSWLDTTFDPFMDGCVAVCMHSIDAFKDDTLVEEVFALLNSCLLSDSGVLAVRGLQRLQGLVTNGLGDDTITDDTDATVCHMLRRCLLVRGLTASVLKTEPTSLPGGEEEDSKGEHSHGLKASEAVSEFVAEEELFADRRYIGSNATEVIEVLLNSERVLDLRWRLFLVKGLGRAVNEWEIAADLLERHTSSTNGTTIENIRGPPNYLENALFGRKLIVKHLRRMISSDPEGNRANEVQSLLEAQTQSLISAYVQKERTIEKTSSPRDMTHLMMLSDLVKDLLDGYSQLDDASLLRMDWLCPLLTSCSRSNDTSIREAVQSILDRALKAADSKPSNTAENPSDSEAAVTKNEKLVADV